MLMGVFHQIWGLEGIVLLLVIDPRRSMGVSLAKALRVWKATSFWCVG